MLTTEQYEELSRRALVSRAARINETARCHLLALDHARHRADRRSAYEARHAKLLSLDLPTAVEYGTFFLGLIAIYGIDVLLFGAPAEYIAGVLGGGESLWSNAAKWVVPACFLGIEVLIALKIQQAREAEQFEFGSGTARLAWLALGIIVALVMPLAGAATAQSVQVVTENGMSVLMVIVLAIISFACHVLVLFGGRLAQDAKTYAVCKFIHVVYQTREARAKDLAATTLNSITSGFILYVHDWRMHNRQYVALPSGPFDRDVVELLQRHFPQVANVRAGHSAREEEE